MPPIPQGPFKMPQYRDFVPDKIRPWIYLFIAFIFQLSGVFYLGAASHIAGSTSLMREDVMMVGFCNVVGVNMPFPLLFRFKFRFTNRQLLLNAATIVLLCDIGALFTTSMPVLCVLAYLGGFFKLCGTFECMGNVQLWMTPKRDFRVFFPLLYIIVVGDISLSGWMAQVLTYYCGSWQAMNWVMALLLIIVLLLVFCLTKNFRAMKPLPLVSVDWLGCVLWSLMLLEVIWLFNYGEYYNWWDAWMWRLVLLVFVLTTFFNLTRMFHIRHPYISPSAFCYKTLAPTLLLYGVAELMNATPKALENVFTGAVMHWGMLTLSVLNVMGIIGTVLGCLFTLLWMKVWHQSYTRLLIIGFAGLLAYQLMMYFYITPELNLQRLYLPTILRTFGYAIYFTALTIYLEELMPFQHFFMGITMSGFARNGMCEAICCGLFSYGMRYHVADNIVRTMPYEPLQSMLVSVKQMFGIVCLFGVAFLLILLLYDVQPVRSTLKKMPYWNFVGKLTRRDVLRRRAKKI
jgi:DHA2 family multidrug resistance protein